MRLNSIVLSTLLVIGAIINLASPNEKTAGIQGAVSDLFGRPLVQATVKVMMENEAEPLQTQTNELGEYKVTHVTPGRIKISATCLGFQHEEDVVLLRAHENLTLDFGLEVGKLADLPPRRG